MSGVWSLDGRDRTRLRWLETRVPSGGVGWHEFYAGKHLWIVRDGARFRLWWGDEDVGMFDTRELAAQAAEKRVAAEWPRSDR